MDHSVVEGWRGSWVNTKKNSSTAKVEKSNHPSNFRSDGNNFTPFVFGERKILFLVGNKVSKDFRKRESSSASKFGGY